jgi:hypothetical protein
MPVVLSLQLMFLVMVRRWRVYRNKRNAAAIGAISVPHVQQGGLSVIATLKANMEGYPGGCSLSRSS